MITFIIPYARVRERITLKLSAYLFGNCDYTLCNNVHLPDAIKYFGNNKLFTVLVIDRN